MNQKETVNESLVELINRRQSEGRETTVYVEGDLANDPPLGNAAATRIAHLLAGDDEGVLRIEPEESTNHDEPETVGCIQITMPKDPEEEQFARVRTRLATLVPEGTDVVVLVDSDDVPWFFRNHASVRVVATGIDNPVECYKVLWNPYDGEVFYQELSGIHK